MSATVRRLPAALAVIAAALLIAPLATPDVAGAGGMYLIDDEEAMHDCQQLTGPDQVSEAGILGGDRISLDTLVLLDVEGMGEIAQIDDDEERAERFEEFIADYPELIAPAMTSYDAIDIDLNIVGYEFLQPLTDGGAARDRTDNAQQIIDLAKEQYGGTRPAGTDIVYVLTDLDIQLPSLGNAVAGLADCIGGVTFDDRAFAVGEISEELPFFVYTFYADATAKIMAHEIGHLMGGHHHYQTCGETVPAAFQANGDVGPCSLMTNAVDTQSLPFGTTNSLVVRGHAEAYAADNDQ